MDKNNTTVSATLAYEICNQISSIFSKPSSTPPPLTLLVNEISSVSDRKGKIFVYGVGREGLMLKALCMRLFHLGLPAHCVFDMTTPPISASDLLIASAGPGGFSTVNAICGVAKDNGAVVLLLTAEVGETVGLGVASVVAHVPARTMANDQVHVTVETRKPRPEVHSSETTLASIIPDKTTANDDDNGDGGGGGGGGGELLPMGSLYEGALFVLFEMVVFELGKVLKQSPDVVRSRHTNLE